MGRNETYPQLGFAVVVETVLGCVQRSVVGVVNCTHSLEVPELSLALGNSWASSSVEETKLAWSSADVELAQAWAMTARDFELEA
jgi:hypothetical protein